MLKRKSFLVVLFIIVSLTNCNAQEKYKVEYKIKPLSNGETLEYEMVIISGEPNYTLMIYRVSNENRSKIRRDKDVSCWPKLLDNSRMLVYMVEDENDNLGRKFTYILDGQKGKAFFVGKLNCTFDISNEGRYLCYETTPHIKENLVIPGIMWKDLKTGKAREYDFSGTFLKDEWAAGTVIKYIPAREVFSLNFSIEDYVFSKGYISAKGGDYHEYTDSIGKGYVNTKNANLWQRPRIDGGMIKRGDNPWHPISGYREVDILEKSKTKVKLGNMNEYWYKVRTFFLFEGWIYGAYITLEK